MEPGARLAQLIRDRSAAILARWEQQVRATGIARALSRPALFDSMPKLVDQLNAILGSAQLLLRRGHLEEPDRGAVDRIVRTGWRMERLIADVLDFTRARLGGGIPLTVAPADLRRGPFVGRDGTTFVVRLPARPPAPARGS